MASHRWRIARCKVGLQEPVCSLLTSFPGNTRVLPASHQWIFSSLPEDVWPRGAYTSLWGNFTAHFWGLKRYHILRLFSLKKRLNYPPCPPCLCPCTLRNYSARLPNSIELSSNSSLKSEYKWPQPAPAICAFWNILRHCHTVHLSVPPESCHPATGTRPVCARTQGHPPLLLSYHFTISCTHDLWPSWKQLLHSSQVCFFSMGLEGTRSVLTDGELGVYHSCVRMTFLPHKNPEY